MEEQERRLIFSIDRVLQCYIRNMSGPPPSLLIENYLREVGFWHVANIGRGCKLDSKLVSAFIEKWDPRHIHSSFHARSVPSLWRTCSYNWGLPVDGPVLTKSVL
ncbi:hypothetical protein J1N35_034356 [Gossypium stocksii]|uniref:Aminotransferase-like plant mobile domain-containing protein n=1 Tax=Gossypium stocksii TaxID=47602 RepID=A0A9D3US64_9ROSI|nr:hypothetical protein J1N35_034356 [Gossypium stocksii]